jgi:hypothetical protein
MLKLNSYSPFVHNRRIFTALFLVTILILVFSVLSITGCKKPTDDPNDPQLVPVSVRFTNSPTPNRAAINPRTVSAARSSANDFQPYVRLYENLGEFQDYITPTKFEVALQQLMIFSGENNIFLIGENNQPYLFRKIVDFKNPITVPVEEVKSGFYRTMTLTSPSLNIVVFTLPEGIVLEKTNLKSSEVDSDRNVTISASAPNSPNNNLELHEVNNSLPPEKQIKRDDGQNMWGISTYIYGPERKILMAEMEGIGPMISFADIDPSRPEMSGWQFQGVVCVPWAGIDIPATAQSVTFEIIWETEGIIEHYYNVDEDKHYFILKNGWWNALNINAWFY